MNDIEKVYHLTEKGREILKTSNPSSKYVNKEYYYAWRAQCISFIYSCSLVEKSRYVYSQSFQKQCYFYEISHVNIGIGILESVKEDLETTSVVDDKADPIKLVINLCERFHLVAHQLRSRHDNRSTIDVQDEYDVQDLFHALLRLYFDDIRREEPAPSIAGSSSRIDFLLTRERILIETKMPRSRLADKRLKEELSIDLKCYQKHPGFDTLIFFVYDPDKCIKNPGAFETDFNENRGDLCVRFSIRQ